MSNPFHKRKKRTSLVVMILMKKVNTYKVHNNQKGQSLIIIFHSLNNFLSQFNNSQLKNNQFQFNSISNSQFNNNQFNRLHNHFISQHHNIFNNSQFRTLHSQSIQRHNQFNIKFNNSQYNNK